MGRGKGGTAMRVFLTGATGFIGSKVARVLVREGYDVWVLLRRESDPWRIQDILPNLRVVHGDLQAKEELDACLEELRPELCLHFAWYAQPGVYLASELNLRYLEASLSLAFRLAKVGCKRLVVAGTCAEYDLSLGYLSETSATRPTTLYAASKLALQTALSHFSVTTGLEVVWPRLFYVYGPAEDERRLIPAVICPVLRNQPTRLTAGAQIRDYLHVEDMAEAVLAVTRSNLSGPVNVGSGVPISVREIALRVGVITGRPELVRLGDLPYRRGDPMFVCANTQRLVDATGWTPRYSLDEGLRQTIEWWQAHLS